MFKSFPTEILERILFYYFHQDELLQTPEEAFNLVTPPRTSTSLLLVSTDFRLLVLPFLYSSISITQPHHWDLLFRWGSGLLVGNSKEAKLRRSMVRELRIDHKVRLPSALELDGFSLSPDRYEDFPGSSGRPFFTVHLPSAGLISVCLSDPLIKYKTPNPSLFPNLDRVTLLPSSTKDSLPQPWSPRLLQQLEVRALDLYREDQQDPSAEFPAWMKEENVVVKGLERESHRAKMDFWLVLKPKAIWIKVGRYGDVGKVECEKGFWHNNEQTRRVYFVYVPHTYPPPEDDNGTAEILADPPPSFNGLATCLAYFDEQEYMADNICFVSFPSDPRVRRRLWMGIVDTVAADEARAYEYEWDGREVEVILLELVKRKGWTWMEEDGGVVDFEEGLGSVDDKKGEEVEL